MKKFLSLLLAVVLCLCGCALAEEPIVVKIASTQSPEMNAIKCLNAFAEDVKEKTGGKVIVLKPVWWLLYMVCWWVCLLTRPVCATSHVSCSMLRVPPLWLCSSLLRPCCWAGC